MKLPHLWLLLLSGSAFANPYIIKHKSSDHTLRVEVLKERGIHFEVAQKKPLSKRIWTSPMVTNSLLSLDKSASKNQNLIENNDFKIKINVKDLCVSIYDKNQKINLLETCPLNLGHYWKGLSINSTSTRNLYGLGQYFTNPGSADGDLVGRVWDPLSHTHGNALRTFSKGANGYAMFPVLYSMGDADQNFLFFYDNLYKQMWSLNQTPYKVESYGDEIRWFVFSEHNIKSLRRKYMKLTGHAPVPKKDVFGLWISEFGYDNWKELETEVNHLHQSGFPLDGAALDLQWFGGSFYQGNVDRSTSRFGTLEFDTKNFPNPKQTITTFKESKGISLMPIEESYISKWLPEHNDLSKRGFMAKWCGSNSPSEINENPWWGIGGMLDWTNNQAGDYWHDLKRKKLTDLGISHHWTDLGEPEMYNAKSCYFGFPELRKHEHADVHNIYNFKWLESIARGYERNNENVRPFMMSRSGTAGIQRFGAGFWSGDIGANMNAMTAHYNAQMHMTFSGVDYYGADIGGFHRTDYSLDGDANELFTQWFANAALFDFPIRSHTWNLSNSKDTSPSKIGHVKSNLANTKLRYKLFPYYYSLAHQAYKTGDAIINPMPLAFPKDLSVRDMGNQKMIGNFLMGAMIGRYGETQRNVYLPSGEWVNFHTNDIYKSSGKYVKNIQAWHSGVFHIPLFVKSGAIIPMMNVDKQTMNISGKRKDGSIDSKLELLVVPSIKSTTFTLFEDDGQTIEYKNNKVSKILITQEVNGSSINLTINKAVGNYKGFISKRDLKLFIIAKNVHSITLNGKVYKASEIEKNKYVIHIPNLNLLKKNIFKAVITK